MSRFAETFRWSWFLVVLLAALSACNEKMRLRFEIITPAGFDWTDGIDRVVVSAGNYTKVVKCQDENCPFSAKFTFSDGDFARVAIHGYDASGQLTAAGYSPQFHATGQALDLAVFFSRIDTGAVADAHFEAAPEKSAIMPYLTAVSDELAANAGTLLFGGSRDGTPVDEVWFYDPYLLALIPLEPLSLALEDAAVMDLKDGNYLIYGGRTTQGHLSDKLLFYSTSSLQAAGSHVITLPADSAPPPMAGARVVEVGPFDRLYDNASGRYLIDAFLVFGGDTGESAPEPAWWFNVYYDTARGATTIETLASDVPVPAGVSAAAARADDAEMRIAIPDAGVFLTARVDTTPAGLSFTVTSREIAGLPPVSGWRLCAWEGRILGLAGRESDQTCDARWFEFAPADFTARVLSAPAGHCESALVRMGSIVMEVGGVNADGSDAHPASYRVWRTEDGELRLGAPTAVTLQRLRILPSVFVLPTGALAVFGGKNPLTGETVEELEIIVPDPRKSGEPK